MSTHAREKNIQALRIFEDQILNLGLHIQDTFESGRSWFEIKNVPVEFVVEFLENYDVDVEADSPWIQSESLLDYIRKHRDHLGNWDVAIPSLRSSNSEIGVTLFGKGVKCQERSIYSLRSANSGYKFEFSNRRRLSTSGIDRAGMSDEEIRSAEKSWRAKEEGNSGKSIPDIAYRSVRERPLLALHLIRPDLSHIG